MIKFVMEISYPDMPAHIAQADAEHLKRALEMSWTNYKFETRMMGSTAIVQVDLTHATAPVEVRQMMETFARGFMASSHLWER